MISCDCFGELVPNFRFPAGKIYENLLNQENGLFEENFNIDSLHVSLKDFENAEKAKLINTKLNKIIDPKNVSKKPLEIIISEVMANQTLRGIKTIWAKGPVICSGSFANNKNFLKTIENNCGYSVILEDNHLGICKGIANLISK